MRFQKSLEGVRRACRGQWGWARPHACALERPSLSVSAARRARARQGADGFYRIPLSDDACASTVGAVPPLRPIGPAHVPGINPKLPGDAL